MTRPPRNTMPSLTSRPRRFRPRAASDSRRGFTLLELLLVLAILVVLAGIVGTNLIGAKSDADMQATEAQIKMLQGPITQYQIKTNSLPDSLDQLKDGPSDAAKKAKWVAPILQAIPKDAWGNDFEYTTKGNQYELRSAGLDGQMNSEDDIVVEGR